MKALFDIHEAAEYLGVNESTVRDYVHQGLLAVVRLPKRTDDRRRSDPIDAPRRKLQFRPQDLDRLITENLLSEREAPPAKVATNNIGTTRRNLVQHGWWKT